MVLRRVSLVIALLAMTVIASSPTLANDGEHHGDPDIRMVLLEHANHVTTIDNGDTGASLGDVIVWGPNPMYDETNTNDTGATTQGVCTVYEPGADCMLLETIVFPDGSTLHLQGIEPGQREVSRRMIVGGSGDYLGAIGTVTVEPTDDLSIWTKTFEIWLDD